MPKHLHGNHNIPRKWGPHLVGLPNNLNGVDWGCGKEGPTECRPSRTPCLALQVRGCAKVRYGGGGAQIVASPKQQLHPTHHPIAIPILRAHVTVALVIRRTL